ncbi:hypothetical protein FUA24_12490 [Seonamhaeicola marinus]|uniref:Tetratricopeptide repeat protein n=2 Tax=Seonamhaeicola marinus TaxID=1912246 RepID=A0A5D0HS17_9FLAO|nr:hypothetical protein FUA24_12490 [Seonamhaeicola marinus]
MQRARGVSKKNPQRSLKIARTCLEYFEAKNDTAMISKCLMDMSETQKVIGKYSLAFDNLWEAQYLSNFTNYDNTKQEVHIRLAKLYALFNMDKESMEHFQASLAISKDLYFEDESNTRPLVSSYMNLALRERLQGNYFEALKYLDSCLINDEIVENKHVDMPFLDAERGYVMLKLDRLNEASKYLHSSFKHTKDVDVPYRTNINMFLGELYERKGELDSAVFYFNKSLNLIELRNYRSDLKADVLFKLSNVFFKKNLDTKAYLYSVKSQVVSDSLMDIKNQTNSELFEIKNTYLKSISEKNAQLAKQQNEIAENKEIQWRLKMISAFAILLVIVLSIIYRMRMKLKRTLMAKREAEITSELKEEQNRTEIAAKSKELTSYALQLIDKEKDIDELLDVLKKESPSNYKSMSYRYKKGAKDLWDSFNLRFTEVNDEFYTKLKEKHPDLSITERKHCALIKLKFGTKEMARILNIVPHSIHISRSRIRKKIGLQRNDSLEDYIANL